MNTNGDGGLVITVPLTFKHQTVRAAYAQETSYYHHHSCASVVIRGFPPALVRLKPSVVTIVKKDVDYSRQLISDH